MAAVFVLTFSVVGAALSDLVSTGVDAALEALAAGCDFIQGFYFSRVLPEREAERYLREHIHIQQ